MTATPADLALFDALDARQSDPVYVMNGADMTAEADLQDAVEQLCRFWHVIYHHCWRGRGDKGFPDLVIVGPAGILWRELKVQDRQPFWDQRRWGRWLQATGADWGIWTEDDYAAGKITSEIAAISHLAVIGQLPSAA